MTKVEAHRAICTHLTETYEKKNHDYGDSFGDSFRRFGPVSALVRIYDKFNRIASLINLPESERKVKDESVKDTLLDMANYCIMTVIEMERKT